MVTSLRFLILDEEVAEKGVTAVNCTQDKPPPTRTKTCTCQKVPVFKNVIFVTSKSKESVSYLSNPLKSCCLRCSRGHLSSSSRWRNESQEVAALQNCESLRVAVMVFQSVASLASQFAEDQSGPDLARGLSGSAVGFALLPLDNPSLVPSHVGGWLQHVVAVPSGDGDEGDGGRVVADLLDESRHLLLDLLEHGTGVGWLGGVCRQKILPKILHTRKFLPILFGFWQHVLILAILVCSQGGGGE